MRAAGSVGAALTLLCAGACGFFAWQADGFLAPWWGLGRGRMPDATIQEMRGTLTALAALFTAHAAATFALAWRRRPGARDTLLASLQMPLVPLLGLAVQPGWAWLAAPAVGALVVVAAAAFAARPRVHDATAPGAAAAATPPTTGPGEGAWTCRTCTRRYPLHLAMGRTPRCPQCS